MGHVVPAELQALSLYALDAKLCARWAEVYPLWQETYKGVDILGEIRKAHTWEVCNPDKRKRLRVPFINNWLSRAQESQHRASQQQGLKYVKPYIPPEGSGRKTFSCERCKDKGIVPTKTVTRWGETVDAYAPCTPCQEKLKQARYGR